NVAGVRGPDRPERGGRGELASLRERLDALPANHPSSPGFPGDATSAEGSGRRKAAGYPDGKNPERDSRGVERYGDGSIDQRARVFRPAELAIAEALAYRSAVVIALAEDHSLPRRQPDALVDGRVTEFKSLSPGATDATVKNQLRAAQRQA